MTEFSPHDVTQLLLAWNNGDETALEKLAPLVSEELNRLAHRYMRRENPGHLLQTTALVNEAYLRLIRARQVSWQNRAHFFAVFAQMMRRILVDYARRHRAKRAGQARQLSLEDPTALIQEQGPDFVALDDALTALAVIDPRKSQVVELRFILGLRVEETAEVLGISTITVIREWNKAKAWLYRRINEESRDGT
jgi:RNA polymerase sigma factor (TIGR02999 family)